MKYKMIKKLCIDAIDGSFDWLYVIIIIFVELKMKPTFKGQRILNGTEILWAPINWLLNRIDDIWWTSEQSRWLFDDCIRTPTHIRRSNWHQQSSFPEKNGNGLKGATSNFIIINGRLTRLESFLFTILL